jgi:hypothetical protein
LFVVESVKLPIMRGISSGDFIHVSLERNDKIKVSKEYPLGESEVPLGDLVAKFNESLSMSVTMYKGSKGKYEVIRCDGCHCGH